MAGTFTAHVASAIIGTATGKRLQLDELAHRSMSSTFSAHMASAIVSAATGHRGQLLGLDDRSMACTFTTYVASAIIGAAAGAVIVVLKRFRGGGGDEGIDADF